MNAIPACFSFIESARLSTRGHGVGSFDVTTVEVVTHYCAQKTLSGLTTPKRRKSPKNQYSSRGRMRAAKPHEKFEKKLLLK
jgi:hypothetical protein